MSFKVEKCVVAAMILYFAVSCGNFSQEVRRAEIADVKLMHSCHHSDCRICAAEFKAVNPPMPQKLQLENVPNAAFGLPIGTIAVLKSDSGMKIVTKDTSGVDDILLKHLRVLYDYRLYLDLNGKEDIVPLDSYATEVCISTDMMSRRFIVDDIKIEETIALDADKSIAIFHYEWSGIGFRQVFLDFKTDLGNVRMKKGVPYRSLEYGWSPELNAMVIREPTKNIVVIVGANAPGEEILTGQHGGFTYNGRRIRSIPSTDHQVSSCIVCNVSGIDCLDVVVATTTGGQENLLYDYAAALRSPVTYIQR